MNLLLSNDYVACCMGENSNEEILEEKRMSDEAIFAGLKYAEQHFYKPVFIHSKKGSTIVKHEIYDEFKILHIVPIEFYEKAKQYYYKMDMSKKAIYDQLTSSYGEQFTSSQAQYAIDHLE